MRKMIYREEALRAIAMPLGGLGTGNLALRGDGALSQWQIVNRINHRAYVPLSFFALKWNAKGKGATRLLQSDRFWDAPPIDQLKTTNDHLVPPGIKSWAAGLPMVGIKSFEGRYPIGKLEYDLGEDCPLDVSLSAWSPLVPGNPDDSGWPVAIFDFEIHNRGEDAATVRLLGTLLNIAGWNGLDEIDGVRNRGFGGNHNIADRIAGVTGVTMGNVHLADDDPTAGEQALLAIGGTVKTVAQWSEIGKLWPLFRDNRDIAEVARQGPTPTGSSAAAAVHSELQIEPGQTKRITLIHAWHFVNRYVDYDQWPPLVPKDKSRFYLGNHYATRGGMHDWLSQFLPRLDELRESTRTYTDRFYAQNLPVPVLDAIGSNVANLRTNICLWTESGEFHGFEGGHGTSTWLGELSHGGSCPMDCTHVWNYEQTLIALWPTLFRNMRDVGWKTNQHPIKGYLPHRTILPTYLPRLWERKIGGPENPAIDGLFAEILKTYQQFLRSGDLEWLKGLLPNVTLALDYLWREHDTEGDGMLRGEQPNTYDIHLYGPNLYIGSQYLAALRAAEEMLKTVGDPKAAECHLRFESGAKLYDETCWNGEYYVQRIPEGLTEPYQFGDGCVADQLLGEFWASELGLGALLPEDHVRSALEAIFRRNFRTDFVGFEQKPRVFSSPQDAGLLNGTYEPHQRPQVPLLYSDETWPGVEYLFAALSIHRGLVDQGLKVVEAVRNRFDGRERNPFNEIECGDHYIRSLAGWSLLHALHGVRYSAHDRTLWLPRTARLPSIKALLPTDAGWLEVNIEGGKGSVTSLDQPKTVNKTSRGDGPYVLEPGVPFTFALS